MIALEFVTIALGYEARLGLVYTIAAILLGLIYLLLSLMLLGKKPWAGRALYAYSIVYLALLFGAMVASLMR